VSQNSTDTFTAKPLQGRLIGMAYPAGHFGGMIALAGSAKKYRARGTANRRIAGYDKNRLDGYFFNQTGFFAVPPVPADLNHFQSIT